MFLQKLKSLGPGFIVTSAFIGPGTVTVCSLAGYQFGHSLLWALIFSIFSTIILQEMCARLGIITQKGLGNALHSAVSHKWLRIIMMILIFSAIIIGNGAYEAGNISGATIGMATIIGEGYDTYTSVAIGILSFMVIMSGSYRLVEKFMIALVLIMSFVFIVTALYLRPEISSLLSGMFIPSWPEGSGLVVIGLIGTTVVPYNFFLHASASATKWKNPEQLPEARFDTVFSIIVGGIISMAIIITAASATLSGNISGAADLAIQLEPLLGSWAKYFVAAGFFAAGITSSITAPLAAAFAASGIFNFAARLDNLKFRLVSGVILTIGVGFSIAGFKPIEVIQFAQVTNGILLPVMAVFLVWVMNKKILLGRYTNSNLQNMLGGVVIIVSLLLGIKLIITAMGIL